MYKRNAAIAIALIAAACTPIAFAGPGRHRASADNSQLRLYAVVTGTTTVDVDRDGKSSIGDLVVLQAADYDKAGGKQIGTGTSICVVTDAAAGNYDCQGSDALPGGEIREAGRILGSDPTHFHFAVIGGTDKYRGGRGQLDGTFLDPNFSQASLLFTLTGQGGANR